LAIGNCINSGGFAIGFLKTSGLKLGERVALKPTFLSAQLRKISLVSILFK
jgi:hypothetical protein